MTSSYFEQIPGLIKYLAVIDRDVIYYFKIEFSHSVIKS
jgi:hypothetical protein